MFYISVLAGSFTVFLYAYSTVLSDYFLIQGVRVLIPTFFSLRDWIEWMLDGFDDMVTSRKTDIISFIETIKETSSDSFSFDYERLKSELAPLYDQLRVREHIDQYIEKLGPILSEIMTEYRAATDIIVPKITPKIEELKEIFKVNAMDTKEKLMPILAVIQRELNTVYGKVREVVNAYVQEYREHMSGVIQRFRSLTPEQLAARREEMNRVAQEILEKFTALQEIAFREGN